MATSVQSQVRVGECVDLYYYDHETAAKQCWATTQNTKYVQQFQNLAGGSSVFTIPPQNGIQDIICEFSFGTDISGASTGLALPRGWGYALIKQVSFRYGGSSQYFLSGQQVLQNALRRQPNRSAADDLLTLGGNFTAGASFASPVTANVVLTLPHNIPSGVGKAHPLPTDLLTQQVQITVELYSPASIFTVAAGGGSSTPPSALNSASFAVQQVMLNNQGDALARRVDMATNAYSFPCEFVQQMQVIPLQASAVSQSVVLTGFRSGEVKAVHCWITSDQDNNLNASTGAKSPFLWYQPSAIQMTYAGDVYARYDNASAPLWNLINGNKAPAVDNIVITAATPPTAAPFLSVWTELPFAQTHVDEDSHNTLVHGKPITNGLVNLDITVPAAIAARTDLKLNVSYIYNTTLLFSQGTADYVF